MKKIDVTLGSFLLAGRLCKDFNIGAQHPTSDRKVSEVLETALNLMSDEITPQLLNDLVLVEGSGWHGPDEVLSRSSVQDVAKNLKSSMLQDTAEYGLQGRTSKISIKNKSYEKLTELKKAFSLSNDFEAARLAISTYSKTKRAVYRGASLSYMKDPDDLTSKVIGFKFDLTK